MVLAHLTSAASLGSTRWLAGVIRCRFDFDKQVAMRLAEQLGALTRSWSPAAGSATYGWSRTMDRSPPAPVRSWVRRVDGRRSGEPEMTTLTVRPRA